MKDEAPDIQCIICNNWIARDSAPTRRAYTTEYCISICRRQRALNTESKRPIQRFKGEDMTVPVDEG